jgi:hypothetical protein
MGFFWLPENSEMEKIKYVKMKRPVLSKDFLNALVYVVVMLGVFVDSKKVTL